MTEIGKVQTVTTPQVETVQSGEAGKTTKQEQLFTSNGAKNTEVAETKLEHSDAQPLTPEEQAAKTKAHDAALKDIAAMKEVSYSGITAGQTITYSFTAEVPGQKVSYSGITEDGQEYTGTIEAPVQQEYSGTIEVPGQEYTGTTEKEVSYSGTTDGQTIDETLTYTVDGQTFSKTVSIEVPGQEYTGTIEVPGQEE